jgi:hypothetical protein
MSSIEKSIEVNKKQGGSREDIEENILRWPP